MKKFIKIVNILVMVTVIGVLSQFNTKVMAAQTTGSANTTNSGTAPSTTTTTTTTTTPATNESPSIEGIFQAGSQWIENGQRQQGIYNENYFVEQFIGLGQLLVGVGIATILIVTVITAIRWITATPDKQAKLKEQLIGLVIATIVIFGAVGIWNLVRGIMKNVETELIATNTNETIMIAKK